MKSYVVYWRFIGKQFMLMPINTCVISANSKKEAAEKAKFSCENIKIIRVI